MSVSETWIYVPCTRIFKFLQGVFHKVTTASATYIITLSILLLHPSGRQKITFYAIKSLIFNGSCSDFEHFSLKIGRIFLLSLKILSSKIIISLFFIVKKCGL